MTLLSAENLTLDIHGTPILRDVSFRIQEGEVFGLVGESGAGKSMTGNAAIGLLDRPAHITGGEIHLNGQRIDNLSTSQMRRVRGKEIGMVFQDPLTSLNPLIPIGDQLSETMLEHLDITRTEVAGVELGREQIALLLVVLDVAAHVEIERRLQHRLRRYGAHSPGEF